MDVRDNKKKNPLTQVKNFILQEKSSVQFIERLSLSLFK